MVLRDLFSLYGLVLLSVILMLCSGIVLAVEIDERVVLELEKNDTVSVVVVLKSPEVVSTSKLNKVTKGSNVVDVKTQIKKNQDTVLNSLIIENDSADENSILSMNVRDNNSKNIDLNLDQRYTSINAFSGELTQSGLEKLEDNALVEAVYIDEIKHIFLSQSGPLINANRVWNVSVNGINITGAGQTVCIIDTGVDYNHTNLGGAFGVKVIGGYDFVNSDNNTMDDHGHGTHVAGIIASSNATYRGVAPDAKIIAIKACNAAGSCSDSNVLLGIEWCVNNATLFNISVISISLGGGQYTSYCDNDINSQYASLINQAVAKNISVVVATGNTDGSFTNATAGISAPACVRNATRVTATDKSDVMASYAFRHFNFTDLITAPGSSIVSLNDGGGVVSSSGTSMSTPHVSGAIVLMKEYWALAYNTNFNSDFARNKIRNTGTSISDVSGSGLIIPRVNVLAMIQPYINFTINSVSNGTTIHATSAFVNITSDVNLSVALLEWNYNNGSLVNYTMNQFNATSFYYNITGLVGGNYTYRVYGNDTAGTFGSSVLRTLFVDQTSPNITFYVPLNNSYYKQEFYLNVSISDAALSSVLYNISNSSGGLIQSNSNNSLNAIGNYTFTDLVNVSNNTFVDGNYTLTVFANDTIGNSLVSSVHFVVDKTLPVLLGANKSLEIVHNNDSLTFVVNVTDLYLNSSLVLFESNFSGSLVNYTMINEVGDKFNYTVSGRTNLTNQRNISYKFYAFDFAGNVNSTDRFNFVVQNRVPYLVNVSNHVNNSVIEVGGIVSFNGTALDDDLDNLTYYWDFSDGRNLTIGQNISYQINTTGNYSLILNVTDGYGYNFTLLNIIVNDTLGPNLSLISYDSSVHLSQDVNQTVNLNVTDFSGLSNVTLYFNGSVVSVRNQSGNNYTWSFGGFSAGSYNFTINATDNFTTVHTTSTLYNFSVISCSDSVQNGDETGTDCGGSCSVCSSSSSSSSSGGGGGGSSSTVASVEAVTTPVPAKEVIPNKSGGKVIVPDEKKIVPEETVVKKSVEVGVGDTLETKIVTDVEAFAGQNGGSISKRVSTFVGQAFATFTQATVKTKGLAISAMVLAVVLFGVVYFYNRKKKY